MYVCIYIYNIMHNNVLSQDQLNQRLVLIKFLLI